MHNNIKAVLFDLDGTLFDTVPTLSFAIQQILTPYHTLHNLAELPFVISSGLQAMIKHCAPSLSTKECLEYEPRVLKKYAQYINHLTKPFSNIESTLKQLKKQNLLWAIVTNKPTNLTNALLKHYPWAQQTDCLVCGDTYNNKKPHPEPLINACKILNSPPEQCIYIGDQLTDIQAGKAANMKTIIADFGYIHPNIDRSSWNADAIISDPDELPALIKTL